MMTGLFYFPKGIMVSYFELIVVSGLVGVGLPEIMQKYAVGMMRHL